jgi:hypothetical protein
MWRQEHVSTSYEKTQSTSNILLEEIKSPLAVLTRRLDFGTLRQEAAFTHYMATADVSTRSPIHLKEISLLLAATTVQCGYGIRDPESVSVP